MQFNAVKPARVYKTSRVYLLMIAHAFSRQKTATKIGLGVFSGLAFVSTTAVVTLAQTGQRTDISTQAESTPWQVPVTNKNQSATNESHTDTNLDQPSAFNTNAEFSQKTTGSNGGTSTNVTVNGESILSTADKSVHKTVESADGNTKITVDVNTASDGGTNAYTNVQTNSFTSGNSTSVVTQTGVNHN